MDLDAAALTPWRDGHGVGEPDARRGGCCPGGLGRDVRRHRGPSGLPITAAGRAGTGRTRGRDNPVASDRACGRNYGRPPGNRAVRAAPSRGCAARGRQGRPAEVPLSTGRPRAYSRREPMHWRCARPEPTFITDDQVLTAHRNHVHRTVSAARTPFRRYPHAAERGHVVHTRRRSADILPSPDHRFRHDNDRRHSQPQRSPGPVGRRAGTAGISSRGEHGDDLPIGSTPTGRPGHPRRSR